MEWKRQYESRKGWLSTDGEFCGPNRRLFAQFLRWEERKLKRVNGLRQLDEACYKTLYAYTVRLANVSRWFRNKPWKDLTARDIRDVHNALEDGRILSQRGHPVEDLRGYYSKIFKAKPFQLANKASLARTVIEYTHRRVIEVRFANEEAFLKLVDLVKEAAYQLLFWLAWDIGENIGTLLQLTTNDLIPQASHGGEPEYLVFLPRTKLKRCRVSRGEPTLYKRTAELIEQVLRDRAPGERLFPFSYRAALRRMTMVAKQSGATTMPNSQPVRWKDLRSGMACHLLRLGWTCDEVNARLGHAPNSEGLNRYINFMALRRDEPKRRMKAKSAGRQPLGSFTANRTVITCPHCGGVIVGLDLASIVPSQ